MNGDSVQPGCDVIKLKMFLGRRIQEKQGTRREYGEKKRQRATETEEDKFSQLGLTSLVEFIFCCLLLNNSTIN